MSYSESHHAEAAPAPTTQALPTMADIDSLAESLDRIDLTLAELDQPRPTPLHATDPNDQHR